jgi:hypothetical protein
MYRRTSALVFGAALLAASGGCRFNCGERQGWFTSNSRGGPPCHLTSNGNATEGCFDPVTGRPVPCPPVGSTTVIPGGSVIPGGTYPTVPGVAPRPDELPYPSPSDMIRPPGVPYAPPYPAPPGGEGASAAPKGTTPVKGTANK